ncbi:MAG: FmdB family zinc ribbon protein [Nitriliruptorales bacterium]
MPTYEYACRDCGEHLEVVQSFKDDALEVCPSCDGRLRKVFSAAGIVFKGSGWHVKDYARSTPGQKSDSSSSSDSDSSKSSSASASASAPSSASSESSSSSSDAEKKSA